MTYFIAQMLWLKPETPCCHMTVELRKTNHEHLPFHLVNIKENILQHVQSPYCTNRWAIKYSLTHYINVDNNNSIHDSHCFHISTNYIVSQSIKYHTWYMLGFLSIHDSLRQNIFYAVGCQPRLKNSTLQVLSLSWYPLQCTSINYIEFA